jgi:lysophospholipase L1-like esterase
VTANISEPLPTIPVASVPVASVPGPSVPVPSRPTWSRRRFLSRTPVAVAAAGAAASGVALLQPAAAAASPAVAGAAATTPTPTRGVWVPPAWGQYAGPALTAAGAGNGRAVVALVGDSICRGFYSSDLDQRGWGGLLAAGLRSSYGDGGSGFRSFADSAVWMAGVSGLSSPSTINFYQSAGNLVDTAGSWTAVTANHLGPGGVALRTTVPTDTITVTVRGTTVRILWLNGGAEAMGGFSYSVDSGAASVVKPTGVYEIAVASTSGLAAGEHTVTITAVGASASTETVLVGVAGEDTTGCLVNQFSRYGQTTTAVNSSDPLHSGTWNGGWQYPADLVVYALGANDAHGALPGDTWAKNVRCWLEGVYDGAFGGSSVGAVDGVLVLPHIGSYDAAEWVYQDYAVRARGIAEAYGLLLIDLWALGRNSWNWWHAQSGGSYWADADSPGHAGSDLIHLSDAGHAFVAETVLSVVTSALP